MKLTFISTTVLMVLLCNGCSTPKAKVKHRTPVLTSEWKRVIYYPKNHLNDFCIFRDQEDSLWHAIGIMGKGSSCSEVSFFHSTSPDLLTPFTNHDPILTQVIKGKGLSSHKHAPHMIWYNGYYNLFYRRPGGTIVKTKTKDPNVWDSLGEDIFSENDARDVCVLKIDDIFYM